MPEDDTRPASLDVQEVNFSGPLDREVRVLADHPTITHRAMDWAGANTPTQFLTWIQFDEQLATTPAMPRAKADVEVLHAARALLVREGLLP